MTNERMLNPQREPQNWILHHGNYQGHRFSALKEINADNVKNLKPMFTVGLSGLQSGGRYTLGNLEATPLVEDGIMYVPDGWGSVYAIDLTSGKKGTIKWKMDPGTDRAWAGDVTCCGVNNRGVALWKDKVISVSLDGRLFSINKATGEVVWERKIADPAIAEVLTIAPLVIRDTAIVGIAGGEFGIRGFVEATDLNTGKPLWRTYTIPGAGEPGNETWKDGKDRWKHGGGSVWETATYDPESDTFYQGVGNAGPDWDAEYRPGDNKWAASVIAMGPNDGKIKWGYQYTPNDPYDFDEISEHPIINAKVNGEDRKLVVHAARNGFFYALDRANGSFVAGKQYVDQLNWTPGLDPKTGRPLNYDPAGGFQVYSVGSHGTRAEPKGNKLCPAHFGGKNWEPTAYSPETGLLYIPSIEGCNFIETAEQKDMDDQGGSVKWRERFTGGGIKTPERLYGSIKAVDPTTGEIKASQRTRIPERRRRFGDGRQSCVLRAPGRHLLRPRRQDPEGAVELQRRHRHQRAADHLFGERKAVRRGAGRLAPGAEHHPAVARAQEHVDGVDAVRVRSLTGKKAIPAGAMPPAGARRKRSTNSKISYQETT